MAEKEQQARTDIQRKIVANERVRRYTAALLGALLIGVAALVALQGDTAVAISLGLAGTGASIFQVILPFLISKKED